MKKSNLKKLIASLSVVIFMMPSFGVFAERVDVVDKVAKVNKLDAFEVTPVGSNDNVDKVENKNSEKYEEVKFGDNKISSYIYNPNEKAEVKEKIEAMNDYKILKPKSTANYEVALAYSDGSYSYVEGAENLDVAMDKVKVLEESYKDNDIIPSLINKSGQVVYATNSMGRVWNHRNGVPIQGSTEITNIYSTSDLKKAFTYVNQGYIDDVPIIEDLGRSAKIQVSSYNGWINKDSTAKDYDLVVVPMNQVTNPSCYLVKDGALYHYISANMTFNGVKGHSIRVGTAPSYLKAGVDYYSYDGVYFYEGTTVSEGLNKLVTDLKNDTKANSINPNNPNYNYYEYLPFRTKTNYTAEDLNKFINNNTEAGSKLKGLGDVLIDCENKYGVNPILTLAAGIHESDYGMSDIAKEKNNIFGINAVDNNPGGNSDIFSSVEDSVREFTKNYISRAYADPANDMYYGGYLGNKQLGANVKYASDPFWGEKIAQYAFTIDYELSNKDINNLKDNNGYQLAMYTGANEVKDANGNVLYKINPTVSGYGGYAGNIVALKVKDDSASGKYKVLPERTTPINEGGSANRYDGNYNWGSFAYISTLNVKLINTPSSEFIPGYAKEDVNKDNEINKEDLDEIGKEYNKTSGSSDFKKYLDINKDGIIDILDIVIIANKIV